VVPPERVTVAPPNVAVTVLLAANPVPVIVALVPAAAVAGESVMCGVTVNVALAPAPETVAVTVWPPAVLAGIVKLAPEKLPVLPVEALATVVPS
jgi:hypothetical protein